MANKKTKLKKTRYFIVYMARLCCRVLIFLFVVGLYIFRRDILTDMSTLRFFEHFTPLHVLWIIQMTGMLIHIFPVRITLSGFKSRAAVYREPETPYERLALLEYVQAMNVRAWRVALIWICFNAIFGILVLLDVLGAEEMIVLSFFYFMCDLICMMLFCPFQKFMMGNRCCVNCRIFDWGHIMMYTPMIFFRSFYSWSLLFTAFIVMLRWELVYAKHPERFWRGSNTAIRCENCTDRLCRIKKPLSTGIDDFTRRIPVVRDIPQAEDLDKN